MQMTEKERDLKREREVNCDLCRWKDTCSVMLFSDTPSVSLSCPMQIHKHTHIPCYFRETNLGTTLRIILFLPWCNTQYGVMETGPNEEKGDGELQALVGDRQGVVGTSSE